jgi:hypothetical protein
MVERKQANISKQKISDRDVIRGIERDGVHETAKRFGLNRRSFKERRRRIEKRLNIRINPPCKIPQETTNSDKWAYTEHGGRVHREVRNGVVIVAGDNHYEPGHIPVMHRALVKLCKELRPAGIVIDGDVCDFSALSRYAKIGWEKRHKVKDEIEAAKDRLHEIEMAVGRAFKDWPLGNHDARFNTILANSPEGKEYAEIHGTSLKDHFPLWTPCWAVWLNENTPAFTICQHRARGGEHSAYRNAKDFHCHYVTGHDHHPYVRGYTSAVQTVYGVNHGMLADIDQSIFVNWTEARPLNWRSAFAVLTYSNGALMPPELCEKLDDHHVWFRGKPIKV